MSYRLVFTPAADRQLDRPPEALLPRLRLALERLLADPLRGGTKALAGPFAGLRRLRIGDYRVVYQVREHDRTVKVVLLSHRRDAYDRLARMEFDGLE